MLIGAELLRSPCESKLWCATASQSVSGPRNPLAALSCHSPSSPLQTPGLWGEGHERGTDMATAGDGTTSESALESKSSNAICKLLGQHYFRCGETVPEDQCNYADAKCPEKYSWACGRRHFPTCIWHLHSCITPRGLYLCGPPQTYTRSPNDSPPHPPPHLIGPASLRRCPSATS